MSRIAIKPTLQPELFTYSFPVRVYFENTDAGGVVYHAEYLKFLERARTEWLRHLGFDHQLLARTHRVVFVVTALAADFAKAARLDDTLAVSVHLESLGKVRCVFATTRCWSAPRSPSPACRSRRSSPPRSPIP